MSVVQIILDTISEDMRTTGNRLFRAAKVMKTLKKKVPDEFQLLQSWSDLLRNGVMALGNPGETDQNAQQAAYYFLTESGEKVLEHASRDPINQAGYLAYLDTQAVLDPVTRAYVEEALATYRACCYKATAVMIGCATENLILDLRDELLEKLTARHESVPKNIDAWQVKTALEVVAEKILKDLRDDAKRHKGDESRRQLYEDAQARLTPIAAEFRKTRNDAGHPASLDPINPADVHCNLLLFPSTAKLIARIKAWVATYYVS